MFEKFILVLLLFITSLTSSTTADNNDDVISLIKSDGYDVEVHHVVTEDGYILELHRIPRGRNETSHDQNIRKPPVFLTHCLMCSSSAYVVLGPNGGLAYMLANNGFDVWLLNSRGNEYSRKHVSLPVESRKFWQFSWHEQGIYDLPAGIDYVLNITGERQLDAIGYSMGSTQLFVLLSEKPEYNEKLRSLTVMAPAVYLGKSKTMGVQLAFSVQDFFIRNGAETGQLEFAGKSSGLKELFQSICKPNIFLFQKLCRKALLLAGGNPDENINMKTVPFYFKYYPEPTSLRTLVHFLQIVRSGQFQKYSFGRKLNNLIYKSPTPPLYDLKKVTVPTNVIWSAADNLTPAEGAKELLKVLPNVKSTYEITAKAFSHADFIW
ncbi:UNVERIFIED_CONTAM: hypothetical protein RMT77_007963 [Armadillidium vulgare]